MKTVKFTTDFKHWLFGINWLKEKLPEGAMRLMAIYFGPWCLMFCEDCLNQK